MKKVQVIGVAAIVVALAGCASNSVETTAEPVDRGPVADLPVRAEALPASVECEYESSGRSAAKDVDKPGKNAQTQGTVDVAIEFASGPVTLELDRALAPCTVASFVSLAKQSYFDDTECHRLTTYPELSVLQCGDPSASGSGGPGYAFADEFPVGEDVSSPYDYQRGYVAMANAGPGTNGSQFFIVFGDSQLSPDYTVFGRVSSGIEVVDAIADKGVAGGMQDGAPAEAVEIVTASPR